MFTFKKIHGFHPPPSCPSDLAAQIRVIIDKYNTMINELETTRSKFTNLKKQYDQLQEDHSQLENSCSILADKYDALVDTLHADETHTKRKGLNVSDSEDDDIPLSKKEIGQILNSED